MESAQNHSLHLISAGNCSVHISIYYGLMCLGNFRGQAYSMQTCVVLFHVAFLALICSQHSFCVPPGEHLNGPLLRPLLLLFLEEKPSLKD